MKLHLGSGTRYMRGYVNVDIDPLMYPDIVHDLEKPLPFPDSCASTVRCWVVMEHLADPLSFISEVHRVLRVGGVFHFRVPVANTFTAFNDLQHKSYFVPKSFSHRPYYDFKFSKQKLCVTLPFLHLPYFKNYPKFPAWFAYINHIVAVFTGIEGEFTK